MMPPPEGRAVRKADACIGIEFGWWKEMQNGTQVTYWTWKYDDILCMHF